jgi:hypothetical protein
MAGLPFFSFQRDLFLCGCSRLTTPHWEQRLFCGFDVAMVALGWRA